jgi:hypothetical protein
MTISIDEQVPEPAIFTLQGPVPFSMAPQVFRGEYTTKDSGKRQEYSTGMVRDVNTGKPRFDLIIVEGVPYEAQALTRLAGLYQRGAEKYNPRNHEKAQTQEELDRFKDSAFRHFMQWFCGETDEDHMAGTVWNLFAYEMTKWRIDNNAVNGSDTTE